MSTIVLLILFLVCLACYTGQTFGNRLFSNHFDGDSAIATPVFTCIYGTIITLVTFFLNSLHFTPEPILWLLGSLNGVVLFLYNLGMIQAARRGPYAFQSIVMLFGGIVVSLLFSVLYWGDRLTLRQILGILIMLLAFVLLNSGDLKFKGIKKGYFFFVISLFFTNGIYSTLMDFQQRLIPVQRNEMIMITFGTSAIISFFALLITQKRQVFSSFRMTKKAALFACLSSVCAAFAVFLLMLLLGYIPCYILYPTSSGSLLVVSVLLSAWILREKLTKPMLIGVLCSVVSLLLLSL